MPAAPIAYIKVVAVKKARSWISGKLDVKAVTDSSSVLVQSFFLKSFFVSSSLERGTEKSNKKTIFLKQVGGRRWRSHEAGPLAH